MALNAQIEPLIARALACCDVVAIIPALKSDREAMRPFFEVTEPRLRQRDRIDGSLRKKQCVSG